MYSYLCSPHAQGTSYYHLKNILIRAKIIKIRKYNLALKKAKTQATFHRKHTLHGSTKSAGFGQERTLLLRNSLHRVHSLAL